MFLLGLAADGRGEFLLVCEGLTFMLEEIEKSLATDDVLFALKLVKKGLVSLLEVGHGVY
jgi:hypothetical protein